MYIIVYECMCVCMQKLSLTSPTYGGRSVGIVRVRTKATEFVFCFIFIYGCIYTCVCVCVYYACMFL